MFCDRRNGGPTFVSCLDQNTFVRRNDFALMIELIQIPIPTRHAWFMDFFVDALAGCIGVALVQLAMNFFPGKRVND